MPTYLDITAEQRNIDTIIATKVFGLNVKQSPTTGDIYVVDEHGYFDGYLPRYSESMDLAVSVADKLQSIEDHNYWLGLHWDKALECWCAHFGGLTTVKRSKNPARVICLAAVGALQVVEYLEGIKAVEQESNNV